jgi:hypothetical protein
MRSFSRNVSYVIGMGALVAGVLASGQAVASAAPGARASGSATTYTCSGTAKAPGTLTGTHSSVVVRGVCEVNAGPARVLHNLVIEPGGTLLAVFGLNDHTGHGHSSLAVGGNLTVERGATLLMGCDRLYDDAFGQRSANFPCVDDPNQNKPTLSSHDTVGGSLIAHDPLGVVVHNSSIHGNVVETGGGGGVNCTPTGVFAQFKVPVYSDYEHMSIGGSVRVTGMRSCWFGAIYLTVHGSVTVSGNTMADPDAMEVVTNTVDRDFTCRSNKPAIQFGDSDGTPNKVGGQANGQCGFKVVLPSPAPEAHLKAKVMHLHISVRMHK